MQYVNDIDGRPAFVRYCRVPGTRCNAIMAMIDKVYALHNSGVKPRMIAKMLKLDRETVRKATKNHKKSRPDD